MESHLAAEHVVSVTWLQRSRLHLRDLVSRDSGGRERLRHFDKQGLSYQDVRARPRGLKRSWWPICIQVQEESG